MTHFIDKSLQLLCISEKDSENIMKREDISVVSDTAHVPSIDPQVTDSNRDVATRGTMIA
jgi:hypothetical protein